jgi:hypothetical protein
MKGVSKAVRTTYRFTRDLMLDAVPYSSVNMALVLEICGTIDPRLSSGHRHYSQHLESGSPGLLAG